MLQLPQKIVLDDKSTSREECIQQHKARTDKIQNGQEAVVISEAIS